MTIEELATILIAFRVWENQARSDEPHYTYSNEYKNLKSKIIKMISKKV